MYEYSSLYIFPLQIHACSRLRWKWYKSNYNKIISVNRKKNNEKKYYILNVNDTFKTFEI